jgi:hypothetical protein
MVHPAVNGSPYQSAFFPINLCRHPFVHLTGSISRLIFTNQHSNRLVLTLGFDAAVWQRPLLGSLQTDLCLCRCLSTRPLALAQFPPLFARLDRPLYMSSISCTCNAGSKFGRRKRVPQVRAGEPPNLHFRADSRRHKPTSLA